LSYLDKMSNHDDGVQTVYINSREYGAAFCIRGLKERAHRMVMTARQDVDGGYALKGSPEAFDDLASDLLDEIEFRISPGLSIRALKSLYNKLRIDEF
jgi:hypothetical protein